MSGKSGNIVQRPNNNIVMGIGNVQKAKESKFERLTQLKTALVIASMYLDQHYPDKQKNDTIRAMQRKNAQYHQSEEFEKAWSSFNSGEFKLK